VAPLHSNRLPLAEPPFGVKRPEWTECASEEEHTAGTLAARNAGDLERYRRRGPGLAGLRVRGEPLVKARCFVIQSANDGCWSAPAGLRCIIGALRTRALRPDSHSLRVNRAVDDHTAQPALPAIHGGTRGHGARSSSRTVSRPSTGSVVRSGPATGSLSHAWRSFAIPVSRRRSPLPRAFGFSRSRARRIADPEACVRGRAWGAGDPLPGVSRLDSRCFLHETTSTGTPLDRTSPSTSRRTLSPNHREVILRTFDAWKTKRSR